MVQKNERFLFVLPNGQLGGAEKILMDLAKHLISQGLSVDVLLLGNKGLENWLGELPENNLKFFRSNCKILSFGLAFRFLVRQNFDFILSSNIHVNSVLGLLRKLGFLKTRFLVFRESTSFFIRFTGLRLLLYKIEYMMGYSYSDLVICQTKIMQQQLLEGFSKSKKWNTRVIPNPVFLGKLIKDAEQPIPEGLGNYALAIGRLIDEKGFDLLIRAFSRLKSKSLKLLILGEGNQFDYLKSLIEELGLTQKVFLCGFISNPMPYIKNAKVCVVSSRIEGFPNVLLQMMALNDNVVSTLCAGEIENIPNISTCIANNEDALLRTIERSLRVSQTELLSNRGAYSEFLKTRDIDLFIPRIKRFLEEKV